MAGWPCCGRSLYRMYGTDGSILWVRDWGEPYRGSLGANNITGAIRSVDTDGTNIFAGGGRASTRVNLAEGSAFSVRCYDGSGNKLWESDVGGGVRQLALIPGVGLAVSHYPSISIGDAVTCVGNASGASILDELYSELTSAATGMSGSATPADILANYNRAPMLKNKVTVGGSTLGGTITLNFDSSLYSSTGLRPLCYLQGAGTVSCPSLANFTLLNPATGAVVWRARVGTTLSAPGAMAPLGGNICVRISPAGLAIGGIIGGGAPDLQFVNSSGALIASPLAVASHPVMGNTRVWTGIRYKDIAATSGSLFVAQLEGFTGTVNYVDLWNSTGAYVRCYEEPPPNIQIVPPLVPDGSAIWGTQDNKITRITDAPVKPMIPASSGAAGMVDLCVRSTGFSTIIGNSVRGYDSGRSQIWSVSLTSPSSICGFGNDVIAGRSAR